jgi:hypothetical protein
MNYFLLKNLHGSYLHTSIFMLTLINTVGITLFLSCDLLAPSYLMDPECDVEGVLRQLLGINIFFAFITFLITFVASRFFQINLRDILFLGLYVASLSCLYTVRTIWAGSNKYGFAFGVTLLDLVCTMFFYFVFLLGLEIRLWKILLASSIPHFITFLISLPKIWAYSKEKSILFRKRSIALNQASLSTLVSLFLSVAGLQLLNNLPTLFISRIHMSDIVLIQLLVAIQFSRGSFGLLSGAAARSLNVLSEIELGISKSTPEQVLFRNIKFASLGLVAFMTLFAVSGDYFSEKYSSTPHAFNHMFFIVALLNEFLLYVYGILRLIMLSRKEFLKTNLAILTTILGFILLSYITHIIQTGILISVTISVLFGSGIFYLLIFKGIKNFKT